MNYECGEPNPNWSAERAECVTKHRNLSTSADEMEHEYDSSQTCNYCGIAAEKASGKCAARRKYSHAAISAHAAHGCGLTSVQPVAYWHDLWAAERQIRLHLEAENERLRALLNTKT